MLRKIGKARQIKIKTKLQIFNSNVNAVLLYGYMVKYIENMRKQTFINKCLCRILHMKWSDKVTNTTLWKWTKQLPLTNEIKQRKWRWLGHTQETSRNHHPSSYHMEPPEKRRRGRPRNTWQRHRKGNKGDGIHQERDGEDGHGQKTVAFLGRWPMFPVTKQAQDL